MKLAILGIPFSLHWSKDRLGWNFMKDGSCTCKSVYYHLVRGKHGNCQDLKWLWKVPNLPKIRFFFSYGYVILKEFPPRNFVR